MSMKGKETMSKQNEKLVVGKLGSSYGIRGWLKVFSYTDNPESIFDYSPW
ncbi:TPA: ribosome maturation factor RimM, partial [Vibrio cholerae O1]